MTSSVGDGTGDAAERSARGVVDGMAAGDFASVLARFDDAMRKAMPGAELVEQLWVTLQAQLGDFQGVIATREIGREGPYRIVHVTCAFAVMPMDLRIVLDGRDRVAGFFVRPTSATAAFGPRPQVPAPPYPYDAREVLYENPTDGSRLAGTLTLPREGAPHPAVLLITGSGTQDRDETIMGHKPFLVIADHLARRGIAALRVDDRGAGGSTGDPRGATLETHATDVEASLAFLRRQPEVDPARVGLLGHSEGGILAALVASRSPEVAFVVSLAGTGISGAQLSPMQVEAILRAQPHVAPEGVRAIVEAQRRLTALVAADADDATIDRELAAAAKVAAEHAGGGENEARMAATITAGREALRSPWFRSFLKLDPRPCWERVRAPVLALIGDKDTQVPADVNLSEIAAALERGGNQDVTAEKLPGLNHLFQHAGSGLVDEYVKIEETFDPATLERIATWIGERARRSVSIGGLSGAGPDPS